MYIYVYMYIYNCCWYKIHQYFHIFSKQLQLLLSELQRTVKFYVRNFMFFLKDILRKIATKFLSTLVLSLALENIICDNHIQKCLYLLQYYSLGCSLANRGTKDLTCHTNTLRSAKKVLATLKRALWCSL